MLSGKKSFFALMAHRRYGKDFIAFFIILICAIKHPGNYYYFAPFFRQAKEIVSDGKTLDGQPLVETLVPKELLKNPKAPSVFNRSDWSCELFNGSKIFLRGANDPNSNVGVGARGIVYTEAALMKPDFYQLMKPAVDMVIDKTDFGVVIFISTPRGKNNWFTKLFIDYFTKLEKDKTIKDRWYVDIQKGSESKTWDGKPVLSEEYIRKQKLEMTPEMYMQEIECACNLALTGAWYFNEITKAYKDKRIGKFGETVEYADERGYGKEHIDYYWRYSPLYFSWDIGRRDHTVIWGFQVNPYNGRIRFIYHYRAKGVGPEHMVEKINKFVIEKGFTNTVTLILPHDGNVQEWSATSKRSDYLINMTDYIVETLSKTDLAEHDMTKLITQINAIRKNFDKVEIDDTECTIGVIKLQEYVRKFNKSIGEYIDVPDHDANDKASDDADAFRTGMIYYINNLMNMENFGGAITTEGEAITFEDRNYVH